MFSKRDIIYLIYSLGIISYLLMRYVNYDIYQSYKYSLLDVIVFYTIPIFFWYTIINYRSFIMTIKRLKKFNKTNEIEYCTYEYSKKNIRKIYARIKSNYWDDYYDTNWYELDYDLTIPQQSYLSTYNDFIQKNNTVEKLLLYMNNRYTKKQEIKENDYKYFKYLSLIFILATIIVHMIICFNI